jgi:hypothetical protein
MLKYVSKVSIFYMAMKENKQKLFTFLRKTKSELYRKGGTRVITEDGCLLGCCAMLSGKVY